MSERDWEVAQTHLISGDERGFGCRPGHDNHFSIPSLRTVPVSWDLGGEVGRIYSGKKKAVIWNTWYIWLFLTEIYYIIYQRNFLDGIKKIHLSKQDLILQFWSQWTQFFCWLLNGEELDDTSFYLLGYKKEKKILYEHSSLLLLF